MSKQPKYQPDTGKKPPVKTRRVMQAAKWSAALLCGWVAASAILNSPSVEPIWLRVKSVMTELGARDLPRQGRKTFAPEPTNIITWLNANVSPQINWFEVMQKKAYVQPGGQDIPLTINGKLQKVHIELAVLTLKSELDKDEQCFVQGWVRRPLGLPVIVTIPEMQNGVFPVCAKAGPLGVQFGPIQTRKPSAWNIFHSRLKAKFTPPPTPAPR